MSLGTVLVEKQMLPLLYQGKAHVPQTHSPGGAPPSGCTVLLGTVLVVLLGTVLVDKQILPLLYQGKAHVCQVIFMPRKPRETGEYLHVIVRGIVSARTVPYDTSGYTRTLQIVIDDSWNVGIIETKAHQAGTPNASSGLIACYTNAKTLFDLEGEASISSDGSGEIAGSVGGSFGAGVTIGADVGISRTSPSADPITSFSLSASIGPVPAELHASVGGTTVLRGSINLKEVYTSIKQTVTNTCLSLASRLKGWALGK